MKSNEITPAQMHELLKRNVFSDIDLERIASMDADQRRELKVSQIDKMLGKVPCADALGWYISRFVDDDNHRRADNPLYDEEDTPLVAWYLEVLELSSNLYSHEVFSLDLLAPGLEMDTADQRQQFTIDNKPLMDWLRQTPYRRVSAMVARPYRFYQFWLNVSDEDAERYIKIFTSLEKETIDALIEMKHHAEQGRQLGLSDEQIRVVDMLWSWVPHDYPEAYVETAKEVIEVVDRALPAKTVIRSRKGFQMFYDQLIPQLLQVIEKYDLPVDLTDRYNLTVGYMYDWLFAKYLGGIVLDE